MEFYCGFLSSWSWHNGYLAEYFKPTRNLLLSNEQIKPVSSTLNQIDPLGGILRKEWEDPIHPWMSGSLCGRTGSFSEDKITGDKQLLPDIDFRLETSRALLSIGLRSSRLYGWGEEKVRNEGLLLCFLQRWAEEYTCTGTTPRVQETNRIGQQQPQVRRKESRPRGPRFLSHYWFNRLLWLWILWALHGDADKT